VTDVGEHENSGALKIPGSGACCRQLRCGRSGQIRESRGRPEMRQLLSIYTAALRLGRFAVRTATRLLPRDRTSAPYRRTFELHRTCSKHVLKTLFWQILTTYFNTSQQNRKRVTTKYLEYRVYLRRMKVTAFTRVLRPYLILIA
jgi:hypothetical protein